MHLCRKCLRDPADLAELLGIAEILRRLDMISARINKEDHTMSQISDALDALSTHLDDLGADLARELTDLQNALAGSLTPDQQAKFDALTAKVSDLKSQIDTTDPAPSA